MKKKIERRPKNEGEIVGYLPYYRTNWNWRAKKKSRSESKTRLSVSYLFLSDIRYRIQSSNEKKRLENMLEAHSPFLRALITFYTQVKLIELTQQGTSVEYFF